MYQLTMILAAGTILIIGFCKKIQDYFGNRFILPSKPLVEKEALVSCEKVREFKKWMDK